jgi:hypothetical protein
MKMHFVRLSIFVFAVVFISACVSMVKTPVEEISFKQESLSNWRERAYQGKTKYEIVSIDGTKVLKASTDNSASVLLRELEIDLVKTPFINWRWRVENIFTGGINEQSKGGDDYPARLYLLASDGFASWEVISVNYVWSSNQAKDTEWTNAWSAKSKMIALRSGGAQTGQWLSEKRNIREDFKRLFGSDVESITAVAVMSDSDNYHETATSYFGDIYFSAD